MTRLQVLEQQNKDLRIRLANKESKADISRCALEDENKELQDQLCGRDKTVAMLQREIGALTKKLAAANDLRMETMQERIDTAVAAAVAAATAPLLEQLAKTNAEIARLKAIINKDSSNSSKPPSKDNFKDTPNNREKSKRSRGGQKGHPGHRLGQPKNLDELIEKGFVKRQIVDHTDGCSEYISRFVIDVEVVTTITEHRFSKDAKLPKDLYNEMSYGDNIKAMSVLLLNEGIIAEQRLSNILTGLTHGVVTISPATLEKFQTQFAQKLVDGGELEAIRQDLLNGKILHTDDTPSRCLEIIEYLEDGKTVIHTAEKKSFQPTIRTHSNDFSTLFTVNPQKDKEGIVRDDILPHFFGKLSHDHEIKFYNYGTEHSTCGAHLLRDLKGLRDLWMIPWAGNMRSLIAKMNRHKNKDLSKNVPKCDPQILADFEKQFDVLMARGRSELALLSDGAWNYNEFKKMINRLTDYKDCYLLFIRDYEAPFSNNLSERDLRIEKTKLKVSGPFRSWSGIKTHVTVRSFISTLKKRKQDLFASIVNVNQGIPVLRL